MKQYKLAKNWKKAVLRVYPNAQFSGEGAIISAWITRNNGGDAVVGYWNEGISNAILPKSDLLQDNIFALIFGAEDSATHNKAMAGHFDEKTFQNSSGEWFIVIPDLIAFLRKYESLVKCQFSAIGFPSIFVGYE